MITIRLHAYLQNNLGDDLMVKILLERYPHCRFFFDRNNIINPTLMTYPNFMHREKIYEKYGRINHLLNIITHNKMPHLLFTHVFGKIKSSCRCSVYIGGSLFFSFPNETPYQRIDRERKLVDPAPLFVIGCNFNPKESDEYIKCFSDFFFSLGGVSFRDQASYNVFKHLSNTQYASDVVWNLDVSKYQQHPKENTVLISVINCDSRRIDKIHALEYEKYISNICRSAVDQGITPKLMSFCKAEGDEIAIQRIWNNLPTSTRDKTHIYYYNGNIDEALDIFSRSSCVVATRFHAMILAMRFQIPFYAISYSEKTRQVMQDMEMHNYCDLESLDSDLAGVCLKQMAIYDDVDSCVVDSGHQFRHLDLYLSQLKRGF